MGLARAGGGRAGHSPQHEDQARGRALAHREGALDHQLHGHGCHREAEEPEQRADGSQCDGLSPQLGHLGGECRGWPSGSPQPRPGASGPLSPGPPQRQGLLCWAAPPRHPGVSAARSRLSGTHQGEGHADHRGQAEANLDGFREMLRPVHVQAKRQRPEDPKHDEQSPAEARKFLQKRPGRGVIGHCAPGTWEVVWEVLHGQGARAQSQR